MRPDPDAIEASRPGDRELALLAAEVRRLRDVVASEPTLTDAEREALEWLTAGESPFAEEESRLRVLRGLSERLGGGK